MNTAEHGPVTDTWFRRGAWPTCKCGHAPRDNVALAEHWHGHGFAVVEVHGRLICRPYPSGAEVSS